MSHARIQSRFCGNKESHIYIYDSRIWFWSRGQFYDRDTVIRWVQPLLTVGYNVQDVSKLYDPDSSEKLILPARGYRQLPLYYARTIKWQNYVYVLPNRIAVAKFWYTSDNIFDEKLIENVTENLARAIKSATVYKHRRDLRFGIDRWRYKVRRSCRRT